MNVRLTRYLLLFVVKSVWSGCILVETYKANKELEEGNYSESVITVTNRLNEPGELPGSYNTRKMTDIIDKAILYYEGELNKALAVNKNYDKKVKAYKTYFG